MSTSRAISWATWARRATIVGHLSVGFCAPPDSERTGHADPISRAQGEPTEHRSEDECCPPNGAPQAPKSLHEDANEGHPEEWLLGQERYAPSTQTQNEERIRQPVRMIEYENEHAVIWQVMLPDDFDAPTENP